MVTQHQCRDNIALRNRERRKLRNQVIVEQRICIKHCVSHLW
jgi:hypothetical protein